MKQDWEIKTLGEVYDVRDGTHDSPKYVKEGFALITSKNLKNDAINYDNINYILKEDYININKRSKVDRGDVLFAMIGTIGNPVVVENEPDFAIKNVALFKVPKDQDSYFLKYYLDSSIVIDKMSKDAKGATQKFVGLGYLRNFSIPLPPLPEQQRIVSILDETFTSIARAKASAERNLKNAKELFESYLQNVFATKGEGWENKTLNQISENLDSKRVPITQNVRSKGSVPYYGASGIVDYVEDYLFDDDLLLVSEDGANLLARTYPIAFSIKGKTWVNNHAHILKFNNIVSQKFVEYYLNSIKLDDYVSGMAQPKLNQKMLNSIIIPFPALTEQQVIINKLIILSAETEKLEAIYQQKLNDLEELKKSILQKAFNGELKNSKSVTI